MYNYYKQTTLDCPVNCKYLLMDKYGRSNCELSIRRAGIKLEKGEAMELKDIKRNLKTALEEYKKETGIMIDKINVGWRLDGESIFSIVVHVDDKGEIE